MLYWQKNILNKAKDKHYRKDRDHDHFRAKYRGAAHTVF